MKRICILFKVLLFTTSMVLSGNLHADKPKVKGYYINKNGEKIDATIEIYTQVFSKKIAEGSYQQGFEYYDKKGKTVKVRSDEAEEFGFTYLEEKYVFRYVPRKQGLNILGPLIDGAFCKLLIDGPCELYLIKVARGTGNTTSIEDEHLFYKDKTDIYVTTTGFLAVGTNKVTLDKFFSDCPDLEARINKKEFKKGDDRYQRLVKAYNTECKGSGTVKESTEEEVSEE